MVTAETRKERKTPVPSPEEARQLLDSVEVTTIARLRDRVLIGMMICSFARIGVMPGIKMEDVYAQQRRLGVRSHENGGKAHAMPCHHR